MCAQKVQVHCVFDFRAPFWATADLAIFAALAEIHGKSVKINENPGGVCLGLYLTVQREFGAHTSPTSGTNMVK